MVPTIIACALIASLVTFIFRLILSRCPSLVKHVWGQIILSTFIGGFFWIILVILSRYTGPVSESEFGDSLCGILILFCGFWCNYWICNLAGGFRVQMQINLVDQKQPVSLDKWMIAFGGLGMEVFLKDRLKSILIPLKIVVAENGNLRLLPGCGYILGKLIGVLQMIFNNLRSI